jgi:REP element-mobilizing transposase RayT
MSRPLRLQYPGAVYHLTSRGNARQKIFLDNLDRKTFLSVLGRVVLRCDWLCHAYCLMDNHYHLLIETPKANLALGMRQLNGIYTQSFNRRHRRVGHLLQGRYKAILVQKEAHLLELCRYVVLNPLRVKARDRVDQWKWSSFRATAGLEQAPAFLTSDWILSQFGAKRGKAQTAYAAFVREGLASRPWEDLRGQIYLGDEAFIDRHASGKDELTEVPRAQREGARPALKTLLAKGDRGILDAYRRHGFTMKQIAAALDVHYATVSRRIHRAELNV